MDATGARTPQCGPVLQAAVGNLTRLTSHLEIYNIVTVINRTTFLAPASGLPRFMLL